MPITPAPRWPRAVRLLLLPLAATLALAACGGGDDTDDGAQADPPPPADDPAADTVAADAGEVVTRTSEDVCALVAPDALGGAAGLTVTGTTPGPSDSSTPPNCSFDHDGGNVLVSVFNPDGLSGRVGEAGFQQQLDTLETFGADPAAFTDVDVPGAVSATHVPGGAVAESLVVLDDTGTTFLVAAPLPIDTLAAVAGLLAAAI